MLRGLRGLHFHSFHTNFAPSSASNAISMSTPKHIGLNTVLHLFRRQNRLIDFLHIRCTSHHERQCLVVASVWTLSIPFNNVKVFSHVGFLQICCFSVKRNPFYRLPQVCPSLEEVASVLSSLPTVHSAPSFCVL